MKLSLSFKKKQKTPIVLSLKVLNFLQKKKKLYILPDKT